jgi:dipeptide/tripeptide permease
MAIDDQNTEVSGEASLVIYTLVFEKLGYFAIAVAALLLILSPFIRRRMHVSMCA